jgi:uroporphyrinogen-III synthase
VFRERGAEVAEVFVYRRVEVAPDPAVRERWASLRAHSGARGWVWVTSAAAYRALRAQLSEPERLALSGLGHVVSSERIGAVVGSLGAAEIVVAAGPSELDLRHALANAGMNGGCVGR